MDSGTKREFGRNVTNVDDFKGAKLTPSKIHHQKFEGSDKRHGVRLADEGKWCIHKRSRVEPVAAGPSRERSVEETKSTTTCCSLPLPSQETNLCSIRGDSNTCSSDDSSIERYFDESCEAIEAPTAPAPRPPSPTWNNALRTVSGTAAAVLQDLKNAASLQTDQSSSSEVLQSPPVIPLIL
ncbi:hypothetical protein, conserved [Trypanosoma brucei gambiense DAL972]|uniref:Uncharacterized protein n=2 Tax=Trypanosoma brucei TaxID=5691 RepID=D0A967_TRYB9|nr:hypothetical protein, conserved [Trypanosoma brucei gambiense DAL972]RHW68135.1 hypothetical protein DPX39_110096400 [Trypanosoma brucei equiperdum]CBH18218.1 hypothetical protein, conserved [Trypanosoma brucei gambiense DAL972]|eukprot:XP_011780482.1 hypothetical protein, conserved [Trypanosoma brucei gambiense DAL972]